MEQNKMEIDATLDNNQVWALECDILQDIKVELLDTEINKYELEVFLNTILAKKIRAILCTLTNSAYEDIVKVVRDKLNLDDLFDNRQKYLN
jgi:hypothetical protein